jgi:hypothetical protein
LRRGWRHRLALPVVCCTSGREEDWHHHQE